MSWILQVLTDSAVVAIILSVAAWLCREWIATRLRAAVHLETEKQLETFKNRLDAAEAEVNAVREAGLEAARASSAAVLAERVTAVKELWQGVNEFGRVSALSMLVSANATPPWPRNKWKAPTSTFACSADLNHRLQSWHRVV